MKCQRQNGIALLVGQTSGLPHSSTAAYLLIPLLLFICATGFRTLNAFGAETGHVKLALHQPAAEWIDGLPLANGISATMWWGSPSRTVLSLNHVDFWRYDLKLDELPDVSKLMHEVRRLMMEGKAKEANDLFYQKVYGQLHNMPRQRVKQAFGYTDAFEPIGDVVIELDGQDGMSDYARTLDLEHGIARATWRASDSPVREECYVPLKEDVVVFTLSTAKPVSGRVYFTRPKQQEYQWNSTAGNGSIRVEGRYDEGVESAMSADLQVRDESHIARSVVAKAASAADRSDALEFSGITELRLVLSVDSARGTHSPQALAEKKTAAALSKQPETIRAEHIREHSAMFDRVDLSLDDQKAEQSMDTAQMVSQAVQGTYPNAMAELMFQFGRYLMMSCNRAGRRPANLQGIWNHDLYPAWDADWHLDMNIEMNHWLCNPANLDECNLPLFKQMEFFIPQGKMIARRMLGCDGILYYGVGGGDGMNWSAEGGFWCGAAPWISEHFWEHYEFTLDRTFLAKHAYPFLKQVGLFYKSWLVKNKDGKYVTGFSFSPENVPPNGFVNNVHCTMDTAQVREVMSHLLEAGKLLNVDRSLWPIWQELHDQVLPYPISDDGALKEWPSPIQEQPAHRHFSHLLPLFPGDEFTRDGTPELFEAARKALLLRETGRDAWVSWSYPYAACFYARLGEGDNALKNLHELARKNTVNNLLICYPIGYRLFQIEANFGAVAAVAEMLLQSHEGFIRLLPALPNQWSTGRYRGLKARSAFEVDCAWQDGKVTEASIKSLKGTLCKLRNSRPWKSARVTCGGQKVEFDLESNTGTISFPTRPGNTYRLVFNPR
ncbi:MAG: glycoside hydrolase family 95 protein [Candidatus Omnitrophica bacterium]|nr:glycoside hydrolase family 95 protein [Candidatus Omnitrophota bacterium]